MRMQGRFDWAARVSAVLCAAAMMVCDVGVAFAAPSNYAFSAKGKVTAPERYTLIAPMGGQVKDFSWKLGDTVKTGDAAISLIPTQVFAACDGVIQGLQARVGDQATQVIAQYGSLCMIDRDGIRYVSAPTTSAYEKAENRDVRVSDVLRVRQGSGDSEETGVGKVIQSGSGSFLVEMDHGKFDLEETVTLYKGTGDTFAEKDRVGKGKVTRPPVVPVMGDGVVAEVLVSEGQYVKRGQALFTLDSASARHMAAPVTDTSFERQGVIAEVLVRPGQFVVQGQALATVTVTETLEAVLDVDELDIGKVSVGQKVRIAVDAFPGNERYATVREIMPQGIEVLDTTKFQVKATLDDASGLLINMHITGYWD